MFNLNKTTKYDFGVVLFAIVIVQLILGVQGFDICDDGFVLSFYQQIYNAPSSVEYSFTYWLSGVVGGLWYELYPKGGVLWFKFFTVIINTLIFYVGYYVFKQCVPKRIALLGLVIALFVNDYGFLVYYHNHLTALLALVSVVFLIKGLEKDRAVAIIIAGAIIGVNVFSRIPNITLTVFVLAIPFYFLLQKRALKNAIKPMVQYTVGVGLGFVIIAILLVLLGQFEIMQNALLSLFDLGATKNSTHNFSDLIKIYYRNYIILFTAIAELTLAVVLFFATFNYLKKQIWLRGVVLAIGFCFTFIWFYNGNIYPVYAMSYVGALLVIVTKNEAVTKTVAFLGLLMLTFLTFGSAGAIKSSGYMCIWLSLPFFFYAINSFKNDAITFNTSLVSTNIVLTQKSLSAFLVFISIAFFLAKGLNISKQAYFDNGSRLKKTYAIKSDLAKGVYTTQRRAEIINDLLQHLEKYVKPNDYLLTYDKIPMVHFLTETRPYMYNGWVWIYDSNSFEKKLNKAEKQIATYPVVVLQKFETTIKFSEPIPNYMSENLVDTKGLINTYDGKKNALMNGFLLRNDYQVVWSNAYFNILKTQKKHD